MPNVLPLPMILVQRLVMLASSPGFKVAGLKGVSVMLNGIPAGSGSTLVAEWRVVPQARTPFAKGNAALPAVAALLLQVEPAKVGPAAVATSLTTIEFGRIPVSVLLTRSRFAVRFTSPFGVIRQEQQEI